MRPLGTIKGTPNHVLQELAAWNSEAKVKRYAHLGPGPIRGMPIRLAGCYAWLGKVTGNAIGVAMPYESMSYTMDFVHF